MGGEDRIALRNVRVFDGHALSEPRTVVIEGSVIADGATAPAQLDAAGAVLLPGLIDAHVHLHTAENLSDLARWGVTTALDMGCWPVSRIAELRKETGAVADFRTAGLPAIGPSGNHARIPGMPADAVILSAEAAEAHVAARVRDGSSFVKGIAEGPGRGGPPPDALLALASAARSNGLRSVIHADTVDAFSLAVSTGADFVTHLPLDGEVRVDDVAAMLARGQAVVPTLTMLEGIVDSGMLGADWTMADITATLATLHSHGVTIVAGTDANNEPGAPFQVSHGASLHHEMELMTLAGMTPTEVLRSATAVAAEAFGLEDRGVIEPGKRADLLLVEGDPTEDISVTRRIRAVWVAGSRCPVPGGATGPPGRN